MPTPPNVLLIMIDCLRSRSLFDPSRGAQIPTLKRLWAEGVVFRNCVSSSTTTTPSVATMFTGALQPEHGIRSLRGAQLNPELLTLAETLQAHGYHTRAETTGPLVPATSLDRGFSVFRHRRGGPVTLYVDWFWNELLELLRGSPRELPWFLFLHVWELHRPRRVPPGFTGREYGRHPYERALSAVDQTRLPAILEAAGENTIVIVVGDHGEIPRYDRLNRLAWKWRLRPISHYVGYRSGHGHQVAEDVVVVPLIMWGPGIPRLGIVETAIRTADLFPTVLDLAGITGAEREQGIGSSLVPLFSEPGKDRPGYTEGMTLHPNPDRWVTSVRHDGWKYVKELSGRRTRLWRLPNERRNQLGSHPDVVAKMEALLESFLQGRAATAHGEALPEEDAAEIERHLRELGYLE